MDAVNAGMRTFYDLLWAPFAALPPWVGLLVIGVLFGVVALLGMKYTTNAKRIERFKGRYQGHILAIKLFRDSFTVVITSLAKTLGWIGAYLSEQFKPVFLLFIPFMLLFAQLQMRLAYRPLDLGARTLVTVDLKAGATEAECDGVTVALPKGLELAAKPVHEPARHRVVFVLVAKEAGAHELKLACGAETVTKTIHAGDLPGAPAMVSPVRANGLWDRMENPAEPAFGDASRFERIELAYPVRALPMLGLDLSFGNEFGMMIVFILITIVAAFALKDVFGVTI